MEEKQIQAAIRIANNILSDGSLSDNQKASLKELKNNLHKLQKDYNHERWKQLIQELLGWVIIFLPAIEEIIKRWI